MAEESPSPALPPAICLMGPTAAGKTDLALALHARLPCELVSVDSALVYRGLDIGTAKPSPELLARVPHRLVDICDPADAYSAGRFRDDALAALADIGAAGRIPLLVGGTMLYFRALQDGLADLPPADPALRAELDAVAARDGLAALHRRLAEVDPESAARIHPNDPQRIQRALEVERLTGTPLSVLRRDRPGAGLPWRLVKLIVAPSDRALLHGRIEVRFRQMLDAGLIGEVARLRARGDLGPALPALRAVGYRQVWAHLDGRYDHEEMVRRAVVATRQLAKRQFTWLRRETQARWFESSAADLVERVMEHLGTELQETGTDRGYGGPSMLD